MLAGSGAEGSSTAGAAGPLQGTAQQHGEKTQEPAEHSRPLVLLLLLLLLVLGVCFFIFFFILKKRLRVDAVKQ